MTKTFLTALLVHGISLLTSSHLYLGVAMAQVQFNDYMPTIWNKLMTEFNNEYGVAGIMGNLYAESGCTPYACQPSRPYPTCSTYIQNVDNRTITEYNFVHYGCNETGGVATVQLGFGLAQWTYYTRKQGLYTYMYANGSSIGDLDNQVAYIIEEMRADTNMYNAILNATSVDDASDYILVHYENPSNQSDAVKRTRRQYGNDIYNQYAGTVPVEPPSPQPPSPDSPIPYNPSTARKTYGKSKMPLWMTLRLRDIQS